MLVLLVDRSVVVDNPRAKVLRLSRRRSLLDDGDLHDFTPLLLNGRRVVSGNRRSDALRHGD